MAMNRMSVATVSSPEFINITSMSPFASKCEIKVLYLGENRNGSFINKETATTMAQTLPGCPIVGYFSESKEDFRDHGDQMIIDGDGIKFKCQTVPYGFVAPDTKVWFQDFEDTDEFGNTIVRTYLMTEGYLWTEQYKEAQKVINEGRPQSMELDTNTLKGHWSTDNNRGIDFFIINDAIFSKLCILGEDVEPCFEGASVTAPDVSSNFSLDEKFTHTLFNMMKELKELTLQNKGGKLMEKDFVVLDSSIEGVTPEPEVEAKPEEPSIDSELDFEQEENSLSTEDKNGLEDNGENQNSIEEFAKEEEKEEEKQPEDDEADSENKEDDDKEKEKASKNSLDNDYALLEQKYNDLQTEFDALKEENEKLVSFKLDIENKEKDALINSFYMLSDEDKKNVIENKANYSLDEIEKELSVICVRKKVNFNLEEEEEKNAKEDVANLTYNLNDMAEDNTPAWLKAVDERKNMQ